MSFVTTGKRLYRHVERRIAVARYDRRRLYRSVNVRKQSTADGAPRATRWRRGASLGRQNGRSRSSVKRQQWVFTVLSRKISKISIFLFKVANLATLQNLASLHQTLPQVASLASHLSSMATMQTTTAGVANGPLNLSVNSSKWRPLVFEITPSNW